MPIVIYLYENNIKFLFWYEKKTLCTTKYIYFFNYVYIFLSSHFIINLPV